MSDAEAAEVTFVGGKAIEQSEAPDSNLEVDEREAAKEAVRKAIEKAGKESADSAKEGKAKDPYKPPGAKAEPKEPKESKDDDSAPERGSDGRFLPKAGESKPKTGDAGKPDKPQEGPDSEDLDLEKAPLKDILKARERVAAIKKKATEDISREKAEFEAQRQAHHQQVYQFQQQQAALQRQAQALANLRSDPARAVQESGLSPEDFIIQLANEGTPEGKQARQVRELQQQIQQMQQYQRQQLEYQQRYQRALQEQQVQQARTHAVNTFVQLGMDDEKYPHVANFYRGNERALVAAGDLTAEEYRNLTGGKKEGSYEDILDYLEDQLAERTKNWYSKQSVGKEKPHKQEEERPKSKGKSLSPDTSGERRALKAKSLKDLDADERLEAAKQAVAVALANSKD